MNKNLRVLPTYYQIHNFYCNILLTADEKPEEADENISDEQNYQTETDRKSSQEEEVTEERPEEIQDENAYDQDDAIAAVEAAQIEDKSGTPQTIRCGMTAFIYYINVRSCHICPLSSFNVVL